MRDKENFPSRGYGRAKDTSRSVSRNQIHSMSSLERSPRRSAIRDDIAHPKSEYKTSAPHDISSLSNHSTKRKRSSSHSPIIESKKLKRETRSTTPDIFVPKAHSNFLTQQDVDNHTQKLMNYIEGFKRGWVEELRLSRRKWMAEFEESKREWREEFESKEREFEDEKRRFADEKKRFAEEKRRWEGQVERIKGILMMTIPSGTTQALSSQSCKRESADG
ncbi:hypothetical protein HDV00_007692 [Rhizophlyctis rosea]|nr:hypothetical protein HDV00_007692 [Rhizophlyctis rosea]